MRISDWSSDVCSSDLIDVSAPYHGDVIGKELHRDGIDQRSDKGMNPGHFDVGHAAFASPRNPFGIGNEDDFATPRLHFLHIQNGYLNKRHGKSDNDNGERNITRLTSSTQREHSR